jgi:TonB family protein
MRVISQLLLTFTLNACWQVALIAGIAALCRWLVRGTAMRYQHALWVAGLAVSIGLPLGTSAWVERERIFASETMQTQEAGAGISDPMIPIHINQGTTSRASFKGDSEIKINGKLATLLLVAYGLFLFYRTARLFRAWQRTYRIKQSAKPVEPTDGLRKIIERCQRAFPGTPVRIFSSDSVLVPVTVGVLNPIVILPKQLLSDGDDELLTSAVGHEVVHIRRRDYLLNLIYECVCLPISFHPGAMLIRRRINQTRELCCDEEVADRLLKADVYARSLVRLAGSAKPLGKLAPTTTVGIADADILEVRIMSLLKRSEGGMRGRKLLPVAVSLILAVPCVAAAALSYRFDFSRQETGLIQNQEDARNAKLRDEKKHRESEEYLIGLKLGQEEKVRKEREAREGRTPPEGAQAELDELQRHQQIEREMIAKRTAALAGLARISMDQAIQIALSQQGGKVMQCSLFGEHWESPGKLAKDGQVMYRVSIFSGDEANPLTTEVIINAIDGTILKTNRERAPVSGGRLNGRAVSLPQPEYPEVARAAGQSGSVAVEVLIDESGNVMGARAISGPPLLQAAAVNAAKAAQFSPTRLQGEPVKVKGVITYDFVPN